MEKDLRIKRFFDSRLRAINQELKACISSFFAPGVLREAAHYTLFPGGKRIRPLLAMVIGEGFRAPKKDLLAFACALELIHNYTLIHDDLPAMDNDDFRRGKPTVHKKFSEALAILLGDAFLTHAFELLAGLKQRKPAVLAAQASGAKGVILGQVLDLNLDKKFKKNSQNLRHINRLKTARLFEASIVGAALLSPRRNKKIIRQFADFSKQYGECFQMADDLADADEEVGKGATTLTTAKKEGEMRKVLEKNSADLENKVLKLPLKKFYKSALIKIIAALNPDPHGLSD
ncbi:MAG: polyprenyl synthetase family protein [Elusimicrobia bacterium]|nr:polyprenyl synthetase family protein [Elusimicrobiota bacterium]